MNVFLLRAMASMMNYCDFKHYFKAQIIKAPGVNLNLCFFFNATLVFFLPNFLLCNIKPVQGGKGAQAARAGMRLVIGPRQHKSGAERSSSTWTSKKKIKNLEGFFIFLFYKEKEKKGVWWPKRDGWMM